MRYISLVCTPTKNRRLNELIGFLLFASATLLFLSLVSYSPLDPSFNTASAAPDSHPARNWIGVTGALASDVLLQLAGISILLMPVIMALLAARWFRSRPVESPIAKTLGATTLLVFLPTLLAIQPWHLRWQHAIAIEGLLGRICGDFLIHYLNLTGAYIVCASVIAAGLYLCTAFSVSAARLWLETRFAFMFALRDRFQDWRMQRAKARALRAAEKRRGLDRK